MDKPMSDDKSKAESQFNWEAIKESIERMKPELIACSDAAHKAKGAVAENDSDADRLVKLGSLVECLGVCTTPDASARDCTRPR